MKNFVSILLLLSYALCVEAQHAPPVNHNVSQLIKRIGEASKKSKDDVYALSYDAADELAELGQIAVPSLTNALRDNNLARKLFAACALLKIENSNQRAIETLLQILKQYRKSGTEQELLLHRNAAYLLVDTAAGVKALTPLINNSDLFVRRSIVFALDELTEVEKVEQSDIFTAVDAAIPQLEIAAKDADDTISCMANEVLGQFRRRKDFLNKR